MPELPEVETVRRGLQPVMEGTKIARVEARRGDLRFPLQKDFLARLDGQTIVGLGRRAKYIVADLSSGDVLLMHLGMSGSFRVMEGMNNRQPGDFHHPRSEDRAHDHIVFHMASGATVLFNDPRRFGYMKIVRREEMEQEPFLKGLGPEPLGNEFDAAMLAGACAGKKTNLKAALLDQRVVAGLGNIYVCEALFRAGISPRRLAQRVPGMRAERLVPAIKAVLREAIGAGGSSLRDYVRADGELGRFQDRFAVYDREGQPCPLCPGPAAGCAGVRRTVQSGRSTFHCPRTQR
jgi:formamidopyrimidine-DNA glycosylase